jgi:amino acid transporter
MPFWLKLVTVAIFMVVMTVIGIVWKPIAGGLNVWLTKSFGPSGSALIIFAVIAIIAYFTYRKDRA